MAVADKSTLITNYEADPKIQSLCGNNGGRVRTITAALEVAAADDDGDVLQVCVIKSNYYLKSIKIFNDAITEGTDYNVGLYSIAGVDVDENLFADAIDLSSASLTGTEVLFEALNINAGEQAVWEMLGLTTDPQLEYYLCLTGVTIGSAAGDILVQVEYSDGT